jgi:membrane protease YdiL (CAAX protease family)
MNLLTVQLFLYSSLLTLLVVAFVGTLGAWIWAIRRLWSGRGLLENVRPSALRQAPWGALTVFSVILLYVLVNVAVTRCYATITGRRPPKAMRSAENKADEAIPGKATLTNGNREKAPHAESKAATKDGTRVTDHPADQGGPIGEQSEAELLVQLAIINVLLTILVPALVRLTSNATLLDLGLDFKNWKMQMSVGAVAALLMTPAVLAIQSLAIRIWPPHKHPVEDMILEEFSIGVAVLAVLSTMILAPLIEEILFRGIVQRWLTRLLCATPEGSENQPAPDALQLETTTWSSDVRLADQSEVIMIDPEENSPVAPGAARFSTSAIVTTSLLFAAMHLPQWPAPIGIFLLSMALGALYQRTGSLISTITMHAAFNGFSTVGLLLLALHRQLLPHERALHALVAYLFFGN